MKEKIRSILFAGFIGVFSISNILTPTRVFSSKENRYLQEFPSLNLEAIMSGKFGEEFEKYSSDQFVGRNNWISLKTISDLLMGKKDNGRIYFGKDDYLFQVNKELDVEQFERNIEYLNRFAKNISKYDKDILISALLVPSKSQALREKLPIFAPVVNEEELLKELWLSLSDNINLISLIEVLRDKSQEDIYYKTDHHWTSKGAYYAYEYYLKLMNEMPFSEEDFNIIEVSKEFLGSNYRKANFYLGKADKIFAYEHKDNPNLQITINNQMKISDLYDEAFLDKTDKYSYFLGGDHALVEINTPVKNGKTILLIKDSFANSFIPFVTNHYENIIVIDPRYFNMSIKTFVKERDIDEILFLYNIQNLVQEKSLVNLSPIES